MKKFKRILFAAVLLIAAIAMVGCSTTKYVTIEANQTAFLIPMNGDVSAQASFESEELLANAKVAAKQVKITSSKVKTGPATYQYIQDAMLVIVDRTPVTREWSSTNGIGTSIVNQAIYAESKESIGFSVGINCSAQIYSEDDAVKFLYSYNSKSLSDIMDTEIRARVESAFVEKSAQYTMKEILERKGEIMEYVRNDVMSYFSERGITITVLGMKDGIEYDDAAVQASINAAFTAERNAEAQAVENQKAVDQAKAEAEATKAKAAAEAESMKIRAEAEAESIRIKAEAEAEANHKIAASLTDQLLEQMKYEAWDGVLPKYSGSDSNLIVIEEEGNGAQ